MKPNKYIRLRAEILLNILRKGKVSPRKIANAVACFAAWFLRRPRSARSPFMINFELGNECNANCVFCRSATGQIYNRRPQSAEPIPKGWMPIELFEDILGQVKDDLLMAVLYINGEPLLYREIVRAVRFASDNKVATLIATNGILLTPEASHKLLDAGLDFVKIAVSGFSQPVHSIQHRSGNIEKIKANITALVDLNRRGRYGCMIMVDYLYYKHSASELELFERFCDEHGILFNVRPGNIRGMESTEPGVPNAAGGSPVPGACDFPWKVLSVNWNGDMLPCCDRVVWSGVRPYASYRLGTTDVHEVWNGTEAVAFRNMLRRHGRKAIDVCAHCIRVGTAFKD